MPRGSGAIVVHRVLEQHIPGYRVCDYSPKLEFAPPLLRLAIPDSPADVIHTTPDHAIFVRRRDRPLVATFHNFVVDGFMQDYSSWMQKLHYRIDLPWLLRRAMNVSTAITAVSQFTADLARRELGIARDIEVIPNGVDTDRFKPGRSRPEGKSLRLLFAGNPSRRKGAHWLPSIADGLESGDRIVCATGLRGQWATALKHPRIEVLGRISFGEMPSVYQSVDALLLPTVREGDSLVVLEAMSCGLPIVATRCSSLAERVQHGVGGFLCGTGNVADFLHAISALRDVGARRQMGQYNRERAVSEFRAETMVERYKALFARVG